METYLDMEHIEDPKRVKDVCLMFKGRALLCWDYMQSNRLNKGKEKINTWDTMVSKFKDKFLPTN